MKKQPLALVVGAIVSSTALVSGPLYAEQLAGTIKDETGKAIANARISVVGSHLAQTTDASGRFELPLKRTGSVELHVEAANFVHKNWQLRVPSEGLSDLTLILPATVLEVIDIKASPLHASVTESALPVTVLSGENLKMRQASTLGDTLKNEVGVHSNFYGSVASSPIIRGLDGPRVLMTQNGLDTGDASRIGPDHSVSAEASTAEQIEVLRGPATLFYGSGAIGGVVNVVDERIPTRLDSKASWLVQRESVNNEKLVSASGQTAVGSTAFYADAFVRENGNYKVPKALTTEHKHDHAHEHEANELHDDTTSAEPTWHIANTQNKASGFTLGSSYLLDNGFVGVSYGRLDRDYGIPGHSHLDAHSEEGDHEAPSHEDEAVLASLQQNRVQLLSELRFSEGWLQGMNTRLGYTDYQHAEIEAGVVGTTFKNQSQEARIELLHREWQHFKGGFSLHYKRSDFEAQGEEAFTPPSTSKMHALGWLEEKHFGPVLLQLGARVERATVAASDVVLPFFEAHSQGHHEAHHDDDHHSPADHDHNDSAEHFASQQTFTPLSFSTGVVWDFTEGYNLGVSWSRSERAPSASELYAFGSHLSTGSYEIGALFVPNPETHAKEAFVRTTEPLKMEVSNNLDVTLRKIRGDFGFVLNAFYNEIDNYYYQKNTGLFSGAKPGAHDTHDSADEAHEHASELPVYVFQAQDARLYGFEAQFIWKFSPAFTWTNQADYIRAQLKEGGDLPRTPPLRLSSTLGWQGEQFSSELRVTHYSKQDKIDAYEGATKGYTLLDAHLNYHFQWAKQELAFYVKGSNLTNQEAKVHSSFLKEQTPLPGRSLGIGLRGVF